jgi:hypothetical protein
MIVADPTQLLTDWIASAGGIVSYLDFEARICVDSFREARTDWKGEGVIRNRICWSDWGGWDDALCAVVPLGATVGEALALVALTEQQLEARRVAYRQREAAAGAVVPSPEPGSACVGDACFLWSGLACRAVFDVTAKCGPTAEERRLEARSGELPKVATAPLACVMDDMLQPGAGADADPAPGPRTVETDSQLRLCAACYSIHRSTRSIWVGHELRPLCPRCADYEPEILLAMVRERDGVPAESETGPAVGAAPRPSPAPQPVRPAADQLSLF